MTIIKKKEFKISPEAPFKNDKLQRIKEIKRLTELISICNSPLVLAVDSEWGSGKSTFINMWNAHLKINGYQTVSFNAWECDFAADPMVAFMGEMDEQLRDYFNAMDSSLWEDTKTGINKIKEKFKQATLSAGIGPASVSIPVSGNDSLSLYNNTKKSIESFKEDFGRLISKSQSDKPFVVFIDELDRCRPDFALELLERIKHIFSIEGIVFVLAVAKEQFCESIKAVYGQGLDAKQYMKKFIDLEYNLKIPEAIDEYIESLFDIFEFNQFFQQKKKYRAFATDKTDITEIFKLLIKPLNLSLREIEQLFSILKLVILQTPEDRYIYSLLLTFLVVLRADNRELYFKYMNEDDYIKEVIEFYHNLIPEKIRIREYLYARLEGQILNAKKKGLKEGKNLKGILQYHIEIKDAEETEENYDKKSYSAGVIENYHRPLERFLHVIGLRDLYTKIEFLGDIINS